MRPVIRTCTASELEQAPNFKDLLVEYAAESAFQPLGEPEPVPAAYHRMEEAGILHILGAYLDGGLVGFLAFMVSTHLRYGKPLASIDLYFITKPARKSGAGLALLREAERLAGSLGAAGLMVGSPVGGNLAVVLPRVGYKATHQVFFRRLP